LGYISGINKVV